MIVEFEVGDLAEQLWESCDARGQDGETVEASDVARALFLKWVRDNARIE